MTFKEKEECSRCYFNNEYTFQEVICMNCRERRKNKDRVSIILLNKLVKRLRAEIVGKPNNQEIRNKIKIIIKEVLEDESRRSKKIS